MSIWLKEKAKYLIAAVLLILAISVGLHDLCNINLSNHLQRTTNYMCSEAFQSWLDEIKSVNHILKLAKTNFDVKEAINYTFAAKQFGNIMDWTIEVLPRPQDFEEHLYNRLAMATLILHEAVSATAAESDAKVLDLDDDTLQELDNLTTTFQNMLDLVGTVDHAYYEIGPVQWLEKKGILTEVTDYVKQIESISIEIYAKYF